MNTYWFNVRTSGGFMRVTLQAENSFLALQLAKALYGDDLLSEGANYVN